MFISNVTENLNSMKINVLKRVISIKMKSLIRKVSFLSLNLFHQLSHKNLLCQFEFKRQLQIKNKL